MEDLDVSQALPGLYALKGTELGVSEWKLIDQAAIDAFSELTGDAGPIHNDPVEAARVSPFGGTIVQGSFLLACFTSFAKSLDLPQTNVAFRMNYGFDRVRIIAPVPTGRPIRASFVMDDLVARGSHAAVMSMATTVEIEGSETPAVVADWLIYFQMDGTQQ